MRWLKNLMNRFISRTQAAQARVDSCDQALAKLRTKVDALPPEQRAHYAGKIQELIKRQAHARNELDDALDDRYDRQRP